MSQPYKTILCVDGETRWSSKPTDWSEDPFTLSKMTTEEYIRSPHFKAFGFCIHEVGSSQPVQWYRHDELPKIFGMYDWTQTAVLAHNAQFDVGIMSMIYGVNPCFIFDTLSMGRALRGVEVGNSLMKLAEDYRLPPKGRAVHSTDGLLEIEPHIEKELADYCKHDVFLCEEIFANFMLRIDPETRESAGPYPTKELRLIDMTVRMYTDPVLVLDQEMLEKALAEDNDKLAKALERVGVEASALASNDQFAAVLEKLGAVVPTKPSPANKDKQIFAFAKNDALFQQMLNGDDEDVVLLCEARLKVKSNMERNRAQRFIDISKRGRLPVPLSYYGAGTGRYTAAKGSNINMQNLKRGSALRNAIMAPEDHVIVVGDLSQIEPRVLAWLAGYETMLEIFRAGGDPYATFGGQMFGITGMSKESHPLLRQSAKSALLGCFGGDTQVLTTDGYKPIVDIRSTDLLWDGVEWVQHEGLLPQGEKLTEIAYGVSATPEHRILVGSEWVEWRVAHISPSLFKQALCSVNLPASTGAQESRPEDTSSMRRGCAAPAATRASLAPKAFCAEGANAALGVGISKLRRLLSMGQRNRSLSRSETYSGSLPVPDGSQKTDATTRACYVVADGKASCTAPMYSKEPQLGARSAQEKRESKPVGKHTVTTVYALTLRTAIGCLTASAQSLSVALTRVAVSTLTMVGAASRSILSGLTTGLSSCGTLSLSTVGTSRTCSSTASTTTAGITPTTYALSPVVRTGKTNARILRAPSKYSTSALPHSKQKMQTYDIALAGPRNRYTIMTDDGPIIVHNCGYQLGWASFAAQLLVGFLGAPPQRYTKADAKQLGVTAQDVLKFTGNKEHVEKMLEIAHTCTDDELLIHCLAAKAIIEKYRAAAEPVVDFWKFLGERLEHSLVGGEEYNYKGVLTFRKNEIEMVNGMTIRYPDLKMHVDEKDPKKRAIYTYQDGKKRIKLYPGKICNNVTQGLARIIMTDGMLRTQKRYRPVLTVHDEQGVIAPLTEAKDAKQFLFNCMTQIPTYMPGIPLNADVGFHRRYGMAKK